MYDDEGLRSLHKDKDYKKSNGYFYNQEYTKAVLGTADADSISIEFTVNGPVSFQTAAIKVTWNFFKRFFITKELVSFRRNFVEDVLHIHLKDDPNIISSSIPGNSKWIEEKSVKLGVMSKICIAYLRKAENREILSRYAVIHDRNLFSERIINEIIPKTKELFRLAYHTAVQNEMAGLAYQDLMNDPTYRGIIVDNVIRSSQAGNLGACPKK